ncbi:unnamed protein product [Rhizophagus irregularis]|nr:unnamed protein product [Rhizophagus irregularis]
MKEIVNEIKLMLKVGLHTNIVRFFGITKKKNNVDSDYLFILEYADSGTLRDYLKNNFNKLNWDIKLQFATQISDAVSCIHDNGIVHRDLHSKNILIHKNTIKLADFDDYVNIYKRCWQDNPDNRPDMRQVFSELKSINLTNEQKIWNNTIAINNDYNNTSNSSSSSYSSTSTSNYSTISSLLYSSLDWLLEIEDEKSKATTTTVVEIEDEKSTTTTTDVQSRLSKNMLLRSFLKDHKKSLDS